jgi:ElaB/YqjD/DUF883 family membrane-anchored ribosome-binding protein
MSNTISKAADDAAHEVKAAAHVAGDAAGASAGEIREDLAALRDDIARLAQQLAGIVAARGGAPWRRAKSNVEGAIVEAQDKGAEAVGAMRQVGDNMADAIDESLRRRPYTTLGLALGIGFIFGATWRR